MGSGQTVQEGKGLPGAGFGNGAGYLGSSGQKRDTCLFCTFIWPRPCSRGDMAEIGVGMGRETKMACNRELQMTMAKEHGREQVLSKMVT